MDRPGDQVSQPGVLRKSTKLLQGNDRATAILHRKKLQPCPDLEERKSPQEGYMYCYPGRCLLRGEDPQPQDNGRTRKEGIT